MNNFTRLDAAAAIRAPDDSYNALTTGQHLWEGYVVCDVVLNGVHTTMEVDTGTASSMISDQQFSLISRGNRNLTLSKHGLPKLMMYSGLVWSGLVWSGLVWSGLVWSGLVWSGLVWSGLVWSGLVWSGLVWSGLVWSGLVWSGLVWSGLVWSGLQAV